jgi:septum site-determining protein MinC
MMDATIEIKGIRDGLLVTLPEGEWETAREQLLQTVSSQGEFFRGARVALQVVDRVLGAAELGALRDELSGHEVTLWAVLSSAKSTRDAAGDLGLAHQLDPAPEATELAPAPHDAALPGEEAILIQRTMRSGHSVRYPGHVFVLGDVNPGAEIIAGGNILVWGRLRGVAHAGAAGDEQAVVCALDLAPTQLRIAGHVSVSPARKGKPKPEMAMIREGQFTAEAWDGKRS